MGGAGARSPDGRALMRFERLDLSPYGRFADRRLAFSPDAALHVVLGRNEAGKTTTLEAIKDFLFGVDSRTDYAFDCGYKALRIGGAVRFADGARLDARRRKGDKNTLVDEADKPASEERLRQALAGLDRETFAAEFGLSQRSLREGGEALLRAGGKLAETLAAGSASLGALNTARRRLDEEANELFTPERRLRGKKLYEAIERHAAAGKALKAAVVDSDEWKAAQSALEQAKLNGLDLADRRRALDAGVIRRKRAQRVRGKLAALREAAGRLAALGDAPGASPAILSQARAALAADLAARADLERLAAEDAEAELVLAGLAVDEKILAQKAAVEALTRQIGAVENFERDLPRRLADEDEARNSLDEIARKLGLSGAGDLLARNPSDAELARARALTGKLKRAEERRVAAEQGRRQAEEALARLDARRREAVTDPAKLKRRFESFAAALDDAKALGRERAALAREAQRLSDSAAALDPPVADLAALARLSLPEEAALARRADAERAAEEAMRAAREKLAEAQAAAAAREAALGRLEAAGGAATRADWEAARAKREAALDKLAAALEAPERADRLETARALTLAADAAAERLIADADRAARLQSARDELARAREQARAREAESAEAEAARGRESAATRALWAPSGIAPGAPSRMAAWRRAAGELLERRDKLEAGRAELEALNQRVEAARVTLAAWLAEAGVVFDGPFEELHRAARDRLAELEADWLAAREVEIARTKEAETVASHARALAEIEAAQAELRREWPAAMASLGLRAEAAPEEAEAALDAWAAVGAPRERLRLALDRIEKIRIGLDAFAGEAAALAAAAPDLAGLPGLQAAARLAERLVAAQKAAAERARLTREGANRAARRAGIEAARAARAASLAETRAALGAQDDSALAAALDRAEARAALEATVAELRRDLADIGDGLDEAQLAAELAEFDPAALAGEIAEAEEAQRRLWDEFKRATEAEAAARARLDALAAGRDAVGAARERAEAAGEIAGVAELWLVRAAAAKLAARAIERHRAAAQDPLIARAGELFALATAGHFAGLGVGYDERDQPILAARRASGATVEVRGLSEGARDQLFLALRLALLEGRAGEPLPFIGDDLLASFDDERARHALDLLAEFGARRQAILFTHHARIAELARGLKRHAVEVVEI
jgi:uncharacterized protein YhaN